MQYRHNHLRKLADYLKSDRTFATSLLGIFLDAYGVEGLEAQPEAILVQIKQDFGVDLPRRNSDKLFAAINMTLTNLPYTDLGTFIVTVDGLSRERESNFQVISPTPIEDVAWGVTEMVLNDPVRNLPELRDRFSVDVLAYIGACAAYAGLLQMPETLKFAEIPANVMKVFHDLADMREISEAVVKISTDKTEDINNSMSVRLTELNRQLGDLPLRYRKKD